jgi:tripartite-type tricarboxylate transporter receptor subunit TctC
MLRRTLLAAPLAASVPWAASRAFAANGFPTRPIRLICYQAAGGTVDLTLRAAQPFLAAQGVRTQIEYQLGGGGNVARAQTYNAPPDGYTMMGESAPSAALAEALAPGSFSSRAFEPIYAWSIEGWAISMRKDSPVRDLKALAELGRTRPIVAGSIGRGGGSHLQLLLLQRALGVPFNFVHFSGSSQAYPQVLGGNIDIACAGPGSGSRMVDQLNFLCVFRDHEAALPGVGSARSQGFGVPSIDQIYYAQATPKAPEDRLALLEAAFDAASRDPGFAAAQAKAGLLNVEHVGRVALRTLLDEGFDLAKTYAKDLAA